MTQSAESDALLLSAIETGLRKCRVEDGSPVSLIREHDIFHITHMVAQEIARVMHALPCCNYREGLDRPCDGMAQPGWPTYVCDTCGARCGSLAHPAHATRVTPPEASEREAGKR